MDIRTLQELIRLGMIDEARLLRQLEAEQKKYLLKTHPYAVSRLPDGRWQTYYLAPYHKKRREIRAASRKALIEKLYQAYREAAACRDLSMTELFVQWLAYKRTVTESPNTIKRHSQHYNKYLKDSALFQMCITDVKQRFLQSFCNQLIKDHALSAKEWTNIKTILFGMFDLAFDQELIPTSPMRQIRISVKFRQIPRKTGRTETFNPEEQKRLFHYLDQQFDKTADPAFLAIKLNFYLGLRIGELVALRPEDRIDNHLHIQREEIRDQETNTTYVAEHTKGNHDRFVPLVPKALAIFDRIPSSGENQEYLFMRSGKRITARQIAYTLEKYAKENNCPIKSSHKLRKTFASTLIANGVPIDTVRELLGHRSLQTTYSYIFDPLTTKDTYERITKAL